MAKKTLVIIPTYNEMDNLPRMLDRIDATGLGLDVLVVDDGSPDGTGAWVRERLSERKNLHLIQREGKQGLGSAYVRGFRYAIEQGYDYAFEMDADFSHDPDSLKDFLKEMGEYDVVVGSRYVNGRVTVVDWPMSRLMLSFVANIYARWATGLPVNDATAGFKCYRVEALRSLDLSKIRSDGYSFQIEVKYKLWKKGYRIKEIPIIFRDRVAGVSKMSGTIIKEALFLLIRLRLFGGSA
jgi:dolichol-phosphate mannosyltransferase